jgi:hypothetical protein
LKESLLRDNRFQFGDLILSNCVFTAEVTLGPYNCAGNISFINCLFKATVRVDVRDNVKFEGKCEFKQNLSIMQFDRVTELSNISVDGQLWLAGRSGASLTVSDINVNNRTDRQTAIFNFDFPSVHISNCTFAKIQFAGPSKVSGDITLANCRISKVDIYFIKVDGAVRIRNSEFGRISIHNDTKIGNRLLVDSSTIGEISFPLSTFSESVVSDTSSADLTFSFNFY